MFYKIGKKIFLSINNLLKAVQIFLIFLALATVLFWLFQLGKAPFIEPVAPFFESIKTFTHLFYNRTVSIAGSPEIDFSFLIASLIMLIIVWGLNFIIEGVEFSEKKYDAICNFFKKKTEILFNLKLEQDYIKDESKNNKFLILLNFYLSDMTKDSFYDKDANSNINEKQKIVLTDFYQSFSEEIQCQKKVIQDMMLLYFDDINNVDKVITHLEYTLSDIKQRYKAQKWQIDYNASIDVYANQQELIEKLKGLISLIKLNLKSRISCLATFKQRYSLLKIQKNSFEGQGVYKINENSEEVFCLKS